jgi:DNA-binding transcriptional MerR regulator
MALNQNKDLKLFYSIGEVAKMFNVSESLLRFWEDKFPEISPHKSGRNIRQYSKDNVETIRLIYNLVKVRGMKLEAARAAMRKNKKGEQQSVEVVERLKRVREELLALKHEMDGLV